MKFKRSRAISIAVLVLSNVALTTEIVAVKATAADREQPGASQHDNEKRASTRGDSRRIEMVEEFPTPGLETELSGIYPHATDNDLYYVVANGKPVYKSTMKPKLPVELRNKLLTVSTRGDVVDVLDLPDGGGLFGGIGFGNGHLWLGPLDPPELWKLDLRSRQVVAQYPLPGPAGGLEFDQEHSVVLVQNYIGHPHLAVVDPNNGFVLKSLWSDENAQGVAKVGGDLLTIWTSSWDADAYSELWVLDEETGRPKERLRLDGVHADMAPLRKEVAGYEGFIALVHTDSGRTGETRLRKYRYVTDEEERLGHAAQRLDRFAAIQFEPAQMEAEQNRHRISAMIRAAAHAGAKYVVLPELATLGTPPRERDAVSRPFSEPVPGPTTTYFGALTKELNIWLSISVAEENEDRSSYYLTSALLDDDGDLVLKVRKRVLRPDGSDGFASVGFARVLMDTADDAGRRLGIVSGDDVQSAVPRLAHRGANTILVSANWSLADPIDWTTTCQDLASKYNVHLVVANRDSRLGGIFSPEGARTEPVNLPGKAVVVKALEFERSIYSDSSLGLPAVPIPSHQPVTPGIVALGRFLFFDTQLSNSGDVSCASCHDPEKYFADGKKRGQGVYGRKTSRNVPSLLNSAFKLVLHWDGNPTTLEQQLKYPITGFAEMDLRSYDELLEYIRSRPDYRQTFLREMSLSSPEELGRSHVARALAAYQRTLISGTSPFDCYFYGGDRQALSEGAQRGLRLFQGYGRCATCHTINSKYALFTDGKFHRLGVGYDNETGHYTDPGVGTVSNSDYEGMFFTPSLRNVAETGPYMHDGSVATLELAILAHSRNKENDSVASDVEITAFTDEQLSDLVAFLESLTGRERYSAQGERLRDSRAALGCAETNATVLERDMTR